MQKASRLLVVTFRQRAPEYPRRVHIDWVRVDEAKLRAGRSDGVVFFNLFPSQCMPATQRKKTDEPATYLRRHWPLKSTATDWLGCSSWWLFALHCLLSLSFSLQSGSCYALNLSLAFWRAQMATRITMMARWKPLQWYQVSFTPFQFLFLSHINKILLLCACLFSNTHTLDKLSSLRKHAPKQNYKQIHTH